MDNIKFHNIDITDGFWKAKQDMVKNATVDAVYNRFKETHRFDALNCTWREGMPDMPHIFWDSDVAKWIEGVSYILAKERNPRLEKIIDDAVDAICKNADENGYFNSHFLVARKDEKFCHRREHELYCAGHLIEAAIAYFDATGKDKFLKAMCKYADYIEKCFKTEKTAKFVTPGHPELELALVKLYKATKDKRYLELSEYFIDEHGKHDCDKGAFKLESDLTQSFNDLYNQDEMPLKDRTTADGHCVRALYLYCGMADIAKLQKDDDLYNACRRLFDNIVNKRMYVTGGVGSTNLGEAFTVDYDLPNRTAYTETCASISMAMFAGRMQKLEMNSKYADIVERVMYNGVLSGVSMDGKAFFYENPLEIDPEFNNVNVSTDLKERYPITQRKEVFGCSCCPPNIIRFIASIADYIYSYDEDALYIHQYINSTAKYEGMKVEQKTKYPENGVLEIITNCKKVAVRIPWWCKEFKVNAEYVLKNGYAYIENKEKITIDFGMPIFAVRANRRVRDDAGRVAIMRGPVVYCIEGIDNGKDLKNIKIDVSSKFELEKSEFLLPTLKTKAYQQKDSNSLYLVAGNDYEEISIRMIPYYAFANRGETEMLIWLLEK